MDHFLKQVKDMGFSGVINFPTVAILEGNYRDNLESSGLGFINEVNMIKMAHDMNLYTMSYVFNPEEAEEMAKAGADILVAHMGLTTKGTIGAKTALTLDDCVEKIKAIMNAGKEVNPDIMVICHGGPIAEPQDAEYVIQRITGIDGFIGASSIERLATDKGIKEQTAAFKSICK